MEEKKKQKTGGRPPKKEEEKRTCTIPIRTTAREFSRLKGLADQRKQPVANLVRELYQAGSIVVITAEQEQLLMQLAGMANNLNQLTRLAHKEGFQGAGAQLGQLLSKISNLLNQWSQK